MPELPPPRTEKRKAEALKSGDEYFTAWARKEFKFRKKQCFECLKTLVLGALGSGEDVTKKMRRREADLRRRAGA